METKKVIIRGEIKTKQRPRATIIGGQARVYTPKDTIYYENYLKSEYLRQCDGYNFGDKPLFVEINCYFKVNKQLEECGDYATALPCVTHKDLDNICKLVDGLNGVAWNDDKQIIELSAHKEYTLDEERIEIIIIDMSKYFTFFNVKEVKERIKINKLENRITELLLKDKLTKTEQARLTEIQEEVDNYYKTRCKK